MPAASTAKKGHRTPIRFCDECRFADLSGTSLRCAHGNRPAFVTPGWEEVQSRQWGWMLRCRDFEKAETADSKARPVQDVPAVDLRSQQLAWRRQAEALGHPTD